MQTTTIIINRPGLNYAQITVTADSSVAMTEHTTGSYVYYALLVDGRYYDLVRTAHADCNPAVVAAFNAALSDVEQAVQSLNAPVAPAYEREIEYCRESRDYEMRIRAQGEIEWQTIGYARTPGEANATINELVHELLTHPLPTAEGVEAHRVTAAETADIVAARAELPLADRTIALVGPSVELDDRDLQAAYEAALAHPETQTSRWRRALGRGYDHLADEARIGLHEGAYFWHPDGDGGSYRVTPAECQCTAFVEGQPCKHRASAIILSFYHSEIFEQAA